MQLRVEKWTSSDNHHEVHWFLANSPGETYVFGANPVFVSHAEQVRFLKSLGFSVT